MSGLGRQRTYDKEFKLEAVRLVLEERPQLSISRTRTRHRPGCCLQLGTPVYQ
jgi:transposase-like protein